jgi:hypothetical protein
VKYWPAGARGSVAAASCSRWRPRASGPTLTPLPALRSWLDSWNRLGAVVTGMERQAFDASPTRYPEGWRAAFLPRDHTTRPWVGQVLNFHATPWHAVQVAARDALRKAERERL